MCLSSHAGIAGTLILEVIRLHSSINPSEDHILLTVDAARLQRVLRSTLDETRDQNIAVEDNIGRDHLVALGRKKPATNTFDNVPYEPVF